MVQSLDTWAHALRASVAVVFYATCLLFLLSLATIITIGTFKSIFAFRKKPNAKKSDD